MPALLAEARASLPGSTAEADAWTPPWKVVTPAPVTGASPALSAGGADARALLFRHRAPCDAQAKRLDVTGPWTSAEPEAATHGDGAPGARRAAALLERFPQSVDAHAERLS